MMRALRRPVLTLAGLLGAAGAVVPCLPLPWLLPPPPAVLVAVLAILAVQGYAAGALVRAAWRRLSGRSGHRPVTTAVSRRPPRPRKVTATAALSLLITACLLPAGSPVTIGYQTLAAGTRPLGALRSGGAGSLVSWGSLGVQGQAFVRSGPDREQIERVTGRPALEPVRAYVGLRSARGTGQQIPLAVAELERDGALARSTILVVVPTGSGWVDPAAVAALEYLSAGNVATVAVQYAERPSWLEYVLGRGRATGSASALVSALHRRLDPIPVPHRPQLLVYGESLGAIGARSAATLAEHSLLVGPPGGAGSAPTQPRTTALLHADDPIGWWSPRLLIRRPAGWLGPWLPVVSFWQVTGNLVTALDAPAGHGHHYGAELVDAWRTTIGAALPALPPGALTAARRAVGGSAQDR